MFGQAPINVIDILLQLDPEVNKHVPEKPKLVFNLKTMSVLRGAER